MFSKKKYSPEFKQLNYPRILSVLFAILFCFLLYFIIIVYPKQKEAIQIFKKLDADNISQIIIKPQLNSAFNSLSNKKIYIQDKNEIMKVVALLKNSIEYRVNHPHNIWECILVVQLNNGRLFACHICSTDNNGTIIYLNSDEDYGWSYAIFKNDKLKSLLESIAVRSRE